MTEYDEKLNRFIEIVKKLRSDEGCPWDKEQSPISLTRYLKEETQESIEAIDADNPQHIKEELGDILYIIVLLAQIYSEEKLFNMGDILDSISEKMIRRHPHVFGDEKIETVAELREKWLEIKDIEKSSSIITKKN